MLLSMTGFGDARSQHDQLSVAVEVRSVNNRYLKISTKLPDAHAALEHEIEKLLRQSISRGTVSVSVRIDRVGTENRNILDQDVLENYWRQLIHVAEAIHLAEPIDLSNLLQLPGVVIEEDLSVSGESSDWPLIREALEEAIGKLREFRTSEGRSMEQDLRTNCEIIAGQLSRIAEIAPQVVISYRDRLHERVRELLSELDVGVDSSDLIREVSIFADRCDINEEITRLRSHLEQFETFLNEETSLGRKLEFLSQEIFREINTIGSKANNVEIAHSVVEMKAAVEKVREVLQNVE